VAGVVEALSSKPNAFDWRIIRRIRRAARTFYPLTLESSLPSPERQDRLEQAASVSVGEQNNEFELQRLLSSAWLVQNRSGVSVTGSAREDRGNNFGEVQPECQERPRAFPALQPIEELPSQRCTDPAIDAQEDAAPSFLTSEEEFAGKGRRRRFVALLIVVLVILFVCCFEFRTYITPWSALLDVARLPSASSRSAAAAASRKSPLNDLPSEPGPGSHPTVKKSAPKPRTAIPQPSADAAAKLEKPERSDDAEASWQMGLAYLKGVGVQRDESQAAKWLKKAANLGDARAQVALSDLYLRGIGVHRDYVRAYTWATIAAGQVGGQDDRVAFLQRRMTSFELQDANRRIQTWFRAQGISR
jgi:hypothetical protein